jgi:hypothetical protein
MEPVTDLWCKLGRDVGLKPSVGQGRIRSGDPRCFKASTEIRSAVPRYIHVFKRSYMGQGFDT